MKIKGDLGGDIKGRLNFLLFKQVKTDFTSNNILQFFVSEVQPVQNFKPKMVFMDRKFWVPPVLLLALHWFCASSQSNLSFKFVSVLCFQFSSPAIIHITFAELKIVTMDELVFLFL